MIKIEGLYMIFLKFNYMSLFFIQFHKLFLKNLNFNDENNKNEKKANSLPRLEKLKILTQKRSIILKD